MITTFLDTDPGSPLIFQVTVPEGYRGPRFIVEKIGDNNVLDVVG